MLSSLDFFYLAEYRRFTRAFVNHFLFWSVVNIFSCIKFYVESFFVFFKACFKQCILGFFFFFFFLVFGQYCQAISIQFLVLVVDANLGNDDRISEVQAEIRLMYLSWYYLGLLDS